MSEAEARREGLELVYQALLDQHGVLDGADLAQQLINDAYRLLSPYTGCCPACTDTLFGILANEVIDAVHTEGAEQGIGVPGFTLNTLGEDEAQRKPSNKSTISG